MNICMAAYRAVRFRTSFVSALTVAAALILSSCSPDLYKNEVKTFRLGVDMAFESFSNQIERSRRIESLEKFEQLPRLVLRDCPDPRNSNMATDSPTKCTMGTDPVPDPPDDNYSYFHAAVRVLSDYAAGLEAVTNATNFKQLKKAHQNLIKSIEDLEAFNIEHGAIGTVSVISKLKGLLEKGFSLILNARRFKILRAAVVAANVHVKNVALVMERDLKIPHWNYVSSQFTILGDAVAEANERIRNSNTESKLVTFVAQWENSDQQAVVYQQALENSPTVILVDGMAGSHQLLEDVVKNPRKGLSNLIEQLGEFYKKAKALNDALEKD